ncbi:hypothetical protein [Flaviflexus massiliensis]|uniref:hypothetical protein n=1 Tax=Flaviflexus massiliensis TaxID=1522309 RepID=UPI0006D5A725|nr:hypothetical protein [Flaviflexus massiliensis]
MDERYQVGPVYEPPPRLEWHELSPDQQRVLNLKGFIIAGSILCLLPSVVLALAVVNTKLANILLVLWLRTTWVAWKYRGNYGQAPLGLVKALAKLFLFTGAFMLFFLFLGLRRF